MVMLSWGYNGKEVDFASVLVSMARVSHQQGDPFIAFTSNTLKKNVFLFYYDGPLTGVKPKDASTSL